MKKFFLFLKLGYHLLSQVWFWYILISVFWFFFFFFFSGEVFVYNSPVLPIMFVVVMICCLFLFPGMFYLTTTTLVLSIFKLVCGTQPILQQTSKDREVFFNKTSYVRIPALNFPYHVGLNFRTCAGGSLFVQNAQKSRISLNVTSEGLLLSIAISPKGVETKVPGQFLDNSWHKVYFVIRATNITLTVADHQLVSASVLYFTCGMPPGRFAVQAPPTPGLSLHGRSVPWHYATQAFLGGNKHFWSPVTFSV